jgi:hypothetical protein
MKLIVKTLKGGKFEVEADGGQTIVQLKGVIVSIRTFRYRRIAWMNGARTRTERE